MSNHESDLELKRYVCFAILMENGEGIVGKSPDYIMEKLGLCRVMDDPESLLDPLDDTKLHAWQERWLQSK